MLMKIEQYNILWTTAATTPFLTSPISIERERERKKGGKVHVQRGKKEKEREKKKNSLLKMPLR
jgi:hypothetical protein